MDDQGQQRRGPSLAGTRLGDWTVVKPLAAGGMGELVLAARSPNNRGLELAAIKQLLPHLCWDPEFVRMFLEEVRIVSGLAHPNIVRVVDWGTGTGGHYFVMEYVHGENLGSMLRTFATRPPPLSLAVGIVAELADGLHYAHEYKSPDGAVVGVVHRDVTPSNVMLSYDGGVKLLDFGIARITGRTNLTKTGAFKGKIGYMSPEQCAGTQVDRRTDVFSLGILLYELSLGRRAFFAGSDFAVVAKILDGDYAAPSAVDRGYPTGLAAIIERALQVDPARRFATAAELSAALRGFAVEYGLDLGANARAQWMRAVVSPPPWPTIDLVALQRGHAHRGGRRSSGTLRTAAAAAAAVVLGAVGFVAGNLTGGGGGPGVALGSEAAVAIPGRGLSTGLDADKAPPDVHALAGPGDEGRPVLPESGAAVVPAADANARADVAIASDGQTADQDVIVVDEESPPRSERPGRRRRKSSAPARDAGASKPGPGTAHDAAADALLPPSWQG